MSMSNISVPGKSTAGSQFFHHDNSAGTRRVAGNFAEAAPSVSRVKVRRLKAEGIQHGRTAAPTPTFILELIQDSRAQA
jgi:hypothetical protein